VIPVKGEEPGAFVLTSKKDRQKYVMPEKTLKKVVSVIGEDKSDDYFTCEWVVLTEEEQRLAEEIRRRYFYAG